MEGCWSASFMVIRCFSNSPLGFMAICKCFSSFVWVRRRFCCWKGERNEDTDCADARCGSGLGMFSVRAEGRCEKERCKGLLDPPACCREDILAELLV